MIGSRPTASDVEEVARLVLMDEPSGPKEFVTALRAEYPDVSLIEASELWRKYRGLDGRIGPTHDYVTGLPR